MSEQNHPWCSDVSRDEAIRRAEDAAAAERPALPDHRELPAAVAELRERVARLEQCATAGLLDRLGDSLPADVTTPREAAPASRDAVNANGLRTERVTLEITQRADRYHPLAAWDWPGTFDGLDRLRGESVRVVDEVARKGSGVFDPNGDELPWDGVVAMLTAERDAALRERDAAKEECERLSHLLKTKESECETHHPWVHPSAAPTAANAGGEARQEPMAWGVRIDSGRGLYGHYDFEAEARGVCDAVNAEEGWSMTVVPLYAAPVADSATTPQPPRGWLTGEERAWLTETLDQCRKNIEARLDEGNEEGAELVSKTCARLTALLARSTPPRVRRPNIDAYGLLKDTVDHVSKCWIAAIREAGIEVAE